MDHHSPDKDYVKYFEQYDATTVVFGDASFTQLAEEMLLSDTPVLMLVLGGKNSSSASGAHDMFTNFALGFDVETPLYIGVPPEPDVECVRSIVKQMETTKPDAVAALGGGSVMDAAKAAYLSYQTGLDVTELFGVDVATKKYPGKEFKQVICIPTTSGTGSEVTPYSNIVDKEKNLKYLIAEKAIVPKLALVDPTFSKSMPADLTAVTALDAMTHSIESLLNYKAKAAADPQTETWGLEAVKLIRYALPRVLQQPDSILDREMLSAAATLGGMCIKNRPTSLPHLCSYSLWGKIPHGAAVSLFLPHFWRFYLDGGSKELEEQTMKLANVFPSQVPQSKPLDVVAACQDFIESVSPFKHLSDIPGWGTDLIDKIASDAVLNPVKLQSAPRPVDADSAKAIITKILSKA